MIDNPKKTAYTNPVAHIGDTGLASRHTRRVKTPLHCGFFVRENSHHHHGGVRKAVARLAGPCTGMPTLFTLPPMFGIFGDRITLCLQGKTTMNTQTHTPVKSLFSVYWDSNPIKLNISWEDAHHLRRRIPHSTIKFSKFVRVGGAA
jgi:hypothetical protein